jgi:cell division transport system permease protein
MKTTFLHLSRSVKYGFQNFGRNFFLSVATTSVMVLTLFGVGFLMVLNQLSSDAIRVIQDKIDISIYIKDEADQAQINEFVGYLRALDDVEQVDVLTKDQALERFKDDFRDNPQILNSLQVIEVNPLPVTVILRAKDTETYGRIVEGVKNTQYQENVILDINYEKGDNRTIIERLNSAIKTAQTASYLVIIVLGVIAILITFNTIRLTMYSYKNEIEIMRLVGATNTQIKGPFFVEGLLFGVFGTIVAFIILLCVVFFISPIDQAIEGSNIIRYVIRNAHVIIGLQLLVGILLGAGSSLVAMNRYLKV